MCVYVYMYAFYYGIYLCSCVYNYIYNYVIVTRVAAALLEKINNSLAQNRIREKRMKEKIRKRFLCISIMRLVLLARFHTDYWKSRKNIRHRYWSTTSELEVHKTVYHIFLKFCGIL